MNQKNYVELPLDRIDEALVQCAVPGFWGYLCIEIRLLPMAALEVELHCRRVTVTQPKTTTVEDSPIVPSNERVNKVRQKLSEFQSKFRIECPIAEAKATFRDGHLMSFEIVEVSVARAGA